MAIQSTPRYKVDRASETWRAVEEWIETRLAFRRANLETVGLDPVDTENCRGAIEELKELREAARRPQAVEGDDEPRNIELVSDAGY